MLFEIKTIRWKLFIYYFILFAVFTFTVLIYQNEREQHFRIAELETELNVYADITNRFVESSGILKEKSFGKLDSLKRIIPVEKVRITIIAFEGNVLYDNAKSDFIHMENHSERPEFKKALSAGSGENIRHSATTNQDYIYYAKSYKNYVVRTAIIYNTEIKAFLKAERIFIPFFILLFVVFGFLLRYIADHIGDSITKLKDFAVKIKRNEAITLDETTRFPNDELGFISREIIQLYQKLKKTKTELLQEKEKLISHLFVLNEGIAFFSKDKKTILNNSHFIFYVNIIAEETTTSVENIFLSEEFSEINKFIDQTIAENSTFQLQELPRMEQAIQKDGSHFNIQCIIFPDKSFEILISDQTKQVRRSIMQTTLFYRESL